MPTKPAACPRIANLSLCRRLARCLLPLTFGLLLLPGTSFGASCDAVTGDWAPTRYYEQGAVVVYNGTWYESRERHSGRQPTDGLFTWKIIAAPECPSADRPSHNNLALPEDAARPPARTQAPSETPVYPKGDNAGSKASSTSATSAINRGAAPQRSSKPMTQPKGQPCPPFSFGQSYLVGQQVEHEGKIYRAIRPTTGTLPGRAMPHHWEITEQPCTG